MKDQLTVTSPAFENEAVIPIQYTGHGEDISPELHLSAINDNAKSLAIIMDDMGHPIPAYNHWVIWNIPVMEVIPQNIPYGPYIAEFNGAIQVGDTEDIDTVDRNRLSTGRTFINSMYMLWIVCWICQANPESGIYWLLCKDIFYRKAV